MKRLPENSLLVANIEPKQNGKGTQGRAEDFQKGLALRIRCDAKEI